MAAEYSSGEKVVLQALYTYLRQRNLRNAASGLAKDITDIKFDKKNYKNEPITLKPLFDGLVSELNAETEPINEEKGRKDRKRKHGRDNESDEKNKEKKKLRKEAGETNDAQEDTASTANTSIEEILEAPLVKAKSPGPLKRLDSDYWEAKARDKGITESKIPVLKDQFVEKAARDLGCKRGKDFRTEKAKKKKAGWAGSGMLDASKTNSVFFSDSD